MQIQIYSEQHKTDFWSHKVLTRNLLGAFSAQKLNWKRKSKSKINDLAGVGCLERERKINCVLYILIIHKIKIT